MQALIDSAEWIKFKAIYLLFTKKGIRRQKLETSIFRTFNQRTMQSLKLTVSVTSLLIE
jgi:hypothetical protein